MTYVYRNALRPSSSSLGLIVSAAPRSTSPNADVYRALVPRQAALGARLAGNQRVLYKASEDLLAGYEDYREADWDGYGALPIAAETIQSARRVLTWLPPWLPAPEIAPAADGSIGMEWEFAKGPVLKAYLDVGPGNVLSGFRRFRDQRPDQHWPSKLLAPQIQRLIPRLFTGDEVGRV